MVLSVWFLVLSSWLIFDIQQKYYFFIYYIKQQLWHAYQINMIKYTLCTSRYTHDEEKIECKEAKVKDLVSFVSALRRGAPLEAQDSKGRSPGQVFNLESIRRCILTVLWNISKCLERCYKSVYNQVISKMYQFHFASWKIVSFFIISTVYLYCQNIYTLPEYSSSRENRSIPDWYKGQ